MNFRFPLATSSWDEKELTALQRVMSSGLYTMGDEVAEFERNFAEYFGAEYAVMSNSGSSANLLMTAALFYTKNPLFKLSRGDEIIVPAVSWPTTYYPLQQYGFHLRFVDICSDTLNYDLNALQQAISDKTSAIMVVNLLGNPNDFDAINSIIDGRNIFVIEDNCESMGASYGEKQAGTFGVMGSFSCFFSHHISTIEGAMVVTNDEELYHLMLTLRAHGWTRNLPKFNHITGEKSDDPFEESYRFVLPGYNLRPLEFSGALGIEQLKKFPSLLEGRRANGLMVQQRLKDHPELMVQKETGKSSWFGFSLLIRPDSVLKRSDLVSKLISNGFECRPIVTGNFTKNDVMKYFDYSVHGTLSNADYIDRKGLFIGNHHYPMSDAIDILVNL